MRLQVERPAPAPAFRGNLRRSLVAATGAGAPRAGAFTRFLAWTSLTSGTGLLGIAAAGLVGAGPTAPEKLSELARAVVTVLTGMT